MFKNEGNLFFIYDFTEDMESDIIPPLTKEIQKQSLLREGHLDLYINSFGGGLYLVQHLIGLVEIAKRKDIKVRTIVTSAAYSAGSILAITGTPGERYIDKDAQHLIHYGSNGAMNSNPTDVDRQAELNNGMFKWNVNHYKKYANVPDLELKMTYDNFFVPANKCIRWKLADKYLEKFDIGLPTNDN